MESGKRNQELKHLGFVNIVAINALICVTNLYEYAKQKSELFRSGARAVEGNVTTVVAPVCEKFKDVSYDLLVFFDRKVDEAANKFDKNAPPLAKQVVSQASCMVQKASELTQSLVSEARTGGVTAATNYAVSKYKEFMLDQGVKIWYKLNQVTPFQMVVQMVVPTAAYWSDKYNAVVIDMKQKGYTVFSYVPLMPLDKIAKVFQQGEGGKEDAEPK